MIDFGMNVQQAGDAPRVRHAGSATPTGDPAAPTGGSIDLESGIPTATRAALKDRGHVIIEPYIPGGFGGYQGILIQHSAIKDEPAVLHGATEPRKDGAALGY